MISLPSVAAAVLAAAAAAARDLLPHRHRAAWRQRLLVQPALGRKLQLWPGRLAGRFLPRSAWSVSLLLGPMGPVRSASGTGTVSGTDMGPCMWTGLHGHLIIWALGEVLPVCILSS